MKKSKYLAILPLLSVVVMASGCAEEIPTETGLDGVYSAIEKINSYDYKQDLKTIVYYTKASYNEKFEIPTEFEGQDVVAADFRVVEDEVNTRIDFTNPNDMYFYHFTSRKYKYLTSYDNISGTAGYTDTIVRFGYQFYKNNNGSYVLEMVGSRGIEAPKSLKLEQYPYITPSADLLSIESTIKSGVNKFNQEKATILFDELFTKIVENTYRINNSVVDTFESDGTNAYKYYATENSLSIEENGEFTFNYNKPKSQTLELTVSSIVEAKQADVEYPVYTPYKVTFSDGTSVTVNIDNDNLPTAEELANPASIVSTETGYFVVKGVETSKATTKIVIEGENKNVLVNTKASLDKNQDITETFTPTMKFWAANEKAQATRERNVKMVYGKYGFLTQTHIEDERSTYNFDFGSAEKYYTSYYTTADFNVVVPHVYGK